MNQMQFLNPNTLNQALNKQNVRAGRLAWLGRWLYDIVMMLTLTIP
jgi:hypothetical protein